MRATYHRAMASATEALSNAVLAIAAEHAVEPVLQKLVDAARELAGARYAAIGVPDGDGGFGRFITLGMSDAELIASLGELPRTHGLLGAMLESPEPFAQPTSATTRVSRLVAVGAPVDDSFLGVPIVSGRGDIAGAFYLTDKESAAEFSQDDQRLIETFAAHAALALENARLHERSRELSIVDERNRLARELHDAVTQKLFGVVLAAESGAALLERDVAARRAARARARARPRGDGRAALGDRAPSPGGARLAGPGRGARQAHRGAVPRAQPRDRADGRGRRAGRGGDRGRRLSHRAGGVAQRAASRGPAARIEVALRCAPGRVEGSAVTDDGPGFEPAAAGLRSRSLGLTTMAERARAAGGSLTIASAPGAGARRPPGGTPRTGAGAVIRVLIADDHAVVRGACGRSSSCTMTSRSSARRPTASRRWPPPRSSSPTSCSWTSSCRCSTASGRSRRCARAARRRASSC